MVDPETRLEGIVTRLRAQGHRLTPQRMAVLKILLKNRKHLSTEQIFERVKTDFPMTSLATIYKTVNVLKEMGEILELSFNNDSTRYDGVADPHPHLICTSCKSILDLDLDGVSKLPQQVAHRTGYRIVSHRFDFYGTCPRCQDNPD